MRFFARYAAAALVACLALAPPPVRGEAASDWALAPPGSTVCTVWPSLVKFYGTAAALAPVTPAEVERRSRRVPFLPEVAGRATYVLYDTLSGATSPVPDYHAGLQGSVLLAPFATGADVGRYRFIGAVHAPGEYALIYRLEAEPPDWQAPVLEPTDGVPGTLIEPDVSRVK